MGRIRAVSFNILHGQRADLSGVDLDELCRCAVGLEPDLLAMQEVDVGVPRSGSADLPALVAEATGLSAAFGKASRVKGVGKYGNALLVRGDLADVEVVPLPKSARRHEPRSVLLATAVIDRVRLTVAATHLSIHRPEVHEQLATTVAALTQRRGPHLLIGDLNLEPSEVIPVVESAGLELADDGGLTFPAHKPRIRIDHVAVSRDLQLGKVDIVETACSDHRALVVEIGTGDPASD